MGHGRPAPSTTPVMRRRCWWTAASGCSRRSRGRLLARLALPPGRRRRRPRLHSSRCGNPNPSYPVDRVIVCFRKKMSFPGFMIGFSNRWSIFSSSDILLCGKRGLRFVQEAARTSTPALPPAEEAVAGVPKKRAKKRSSAPAATEGGVEMPPKKLRVLNATKVLPAPLCHWDIMIFHIWAQSLLTVRCFW